MTANQYEEDNEDVPTIGKKSDRSSGVGGITSIVGGEVGQTHNALRDNISSNFVGYTSFLALNYVPGLGPFCEYFNYFVSLSIYRIVLTNLYISYVVGYKFVCMNSYNTIVICTNSYV
jgi:hypothetical protein